MALAPDFVLYHVVCLTIAALVATALSSSGSARPMASFYAYYLMHDYAHTAQLHGAYPPDLEARLAQFRRHHRRGAAR